MHTAVFNLNDIPLLLVLFQCVLLAILLIVTNHGKILSNLFMTLFLIAVGLDSLDTLIYWSPNIKEVFLTHSVHVFFVFKFSVYIKAPMLYLYTKSVVYSDFKLRWRDGLHLLPLVLFPLYLALLYHDLGDLIHKATRDYKILFSNPFYQFNLWASNAVYVFYSAMSYRLWLKYNNHLKQNFSSIETIDHSWLRLVIVGFVAIWMWNFAGYLLDLLMDSIWLPDIMGVIGNYFNFIFINALVFYSLIHSHVFQGVQSETEQKRNVDPDAIDARHITLLTESMEEKKIFLDPEITLEQLAERVGMPIRQVSNIINRHFKKNFYEYVNYYRVEQAKLLLSQSQRSISMLDVMADAGFNSKSAFNRYFKKFVNMTPTEFRDFALAQAEGQPQMNQPKTPGQ